jgi:hypothetical protein
MPQQTVDINVFKGMITSADPKDIPETSASDCANIDFSSEKGILQGLQIDVLEYQADPGTFTEFVNNSLSTLRHISPLGAQFSADKYFIGVRSSQYSPGTRKFEVYIYDEETNAVIKSTLVYNYTVPSSAQTTKLAAQQDAFEVTTCLYGIGGTNILTSGGMFNADVSGEKSVPMELPFIKHNQFQATSSQNTTSDWRTPGGVFSGGTPVRNKTGFLNLSGDFSNLYWLKLDNAGVTQTNSTIGLVGMAPSDTSSNSVSWGGSTGSIIESGYVYYYYSAEILYQTETPLTVFGADSDNNDTSEVLLRIYLKADNSSYASPKVDPRITAICFYRVWSPLPLTNPDEYPKVFVGRIPIEELQTFNTISRPAGGSFVFNPLAVANHFQYYLFDTTPSATTSPTYEDRTGIPDTLNEHKVYYGLSIECNGYQFAARSQVVSYQPPSGAFTVGRLDDVLENTSTQILRSERNRPRVFDWSQDFVNVPFAVDGLGSYSGKLFAFGKGSMAILDPETLSIDDVFTDIGILHNDMQISIESGLYWCDQRSVYQYDGVRINKIGVYIEHDATALLSWQENALLFDPTTNVSYNGTSNDGANFYGGHVLYDSEHNAVIFHLPLTFQDNPPNYVEYMYFIDTQDWTRVNAFPQRSKLEAVEQSGALHSHYVVSDGAGADNNRGAIYSIGTGATRTGWSWQSKELGFQGTVFGNRKATYRYQVHGSVPTSTGLAVSEDDAAYTNITLSSPSGGIQTGNRSGSGVTYFFRKMKMKLVGIAGSTVSAVSIRLRGLER